MINFQRISPGHYETADGQVRIIREKSQMGNRAPEIVWSVCFKNYSLPTSYESFAEAKSEAWVWLLTASEKWNKKVLDGLYGKHQS